MLRLFLNSKVFWSANEAECPTPEYAIFSLKTSHRIDDIDSMTFTMLRTHPMFNQIIEKRSTFLLCDSEVLFLGKVVNIESSYDFKVDITCEEWLGCTKDDYWGPYFLDLTAAQRTKYDTVDEIIDYTINHLNRTKDAYCGINTDWPNFPKVKKGFTNYTGEAKEIHEFDLGCKTLYDVMFNEVISKCGGFWRTRVIGEYEKVDNVVVGFKLQKVLLDYLSTDSDFDIDPETGLIIDEYEVPPDEEFIEVNDDGTLIREETDPADEIVKPNTGTGLPDDPTQYTQREVYEHRLYPSNPENVPAIPEGEEAVVSENVMGSIDFDYINMVTLEENYLIDLLSTDSDGVPYYRYYGVDVSVAGTDSDKLVDSDGNILDVTLVASNEDGEYIYMRPKIGINRYSVSIKPLYVNYNDDGHVDSFTYNSATYKVKSSINPDTYILFKTIIIANGDRQT